MAVIIAKVIIIINDTVNNKTGDSINIGTETCIYVYTEICNM